MNVQSQVIVSRNVQLVTEEVMDGTALALHNASIFHRIGTGSDHEVVLTVMAHRNGRPGMFVTSDDRAMFLREYLQQNAWEVIAIFRDGQRVKGKLERAAEHAHQEIGDINTGLQPAEFVPAVLRELEQELGEALGVSNA